MNAVVSQKYPAYKDSGVEWIGEIPEGWEVKKLKNVVDMKVSNVNKHIKPFEPKVKLCNYVDVYRNDFVTDNCDFMVASASQDEIRNFKIKINDVIITKDSEDWLDIGVPALVKYEEESLICGYHLAVLRPKKGIRGDFLFRAFLTPILKIQLSLNANGVTRFGISHRSIKSLWMIVPPFTVQTAIANFLDEKCGKIDKAVAQKEKMVALLKERKQIMIQQAVTKGLNPEAKMKDSGVDWIGEIPEGWKVKRCKYLFFEADERSEEGEEKLLSVSHMTGVTPRSEKDVNMFLAENYAGSKLCKNGDLVFNIMWAWMGALGVSHQEGIVSPSYGVYRQKRANNNFHPIYLEELLKSNNYIEHYNRVSTGLHSSRLRFYAHMFFNMELGFPSTEQQQAIVDYIQKQSAKINKAISLQQKQIEKLKEYKSTLINSAVTGKIKVTGDHL